MESKLSGLDDGKPYRRGQMLEEKSKKQTRDGFCIPGLLAEPTGTDGFRVLCHQFFASSWPRLGNCISRCKTCSLTMKPMRPTLLRWVANGDQDQNTRHMAFPLPTGRWSFIA